MSRWLGAGSMAAMIITPTTTAMGLAAATEAATVTDGARAQSRHHGQSKSGEEIEKAVAGAATLRAASLP